MAKLNKNQVRAKSFLGSVMASIYRDVEYKAEERDEVEIYEGEAEILHFDQVAGYAKYVVRKKVLAESSYGNYYDAPESAELKFTLESAFLENLESCAGNILPNITAHINDLLSGMEGKLITE